LERSSKGRQVATMNPSLSSPLLFLGAPGLVGNHVIPAFAETGVRVLAGSRRGLSVGGAPGVAVDMRDRESLARAMRGIATVAFVISDVADMESIGSNVVSAAQSAGVKRLLWFSSFGAKPENQARFSRRHPVIDEAVRASGIPHTILRPNFFMQDFTAFYAETIRTTGTIFLPLGHARVSHLDLRDLAEAAVAALKDDRQLNCTFDLSGPQALHTSEVAEQIGSAIGRPVRYQPITAAAMEASLRDAGMDSWFAAGLAELYAWVRDSGLAGEVTDATEQLLGRKPNSFRQFAIDYRSAFLD
jgi:NAD(P)H dehydrogenase (quinone)